MIAPTPAVSTVRGCWPASGPASDTTKTGRIRKYGNRIRHPRRKEASYDGTTAQSPARYAALRGNGNGDREGGADTLRRFEGHRAAEDVLRHLAHHRETRAAAAHRLGGESRLEHPVHEVGGNPHAAVGDRHAQ